MRADKNTGQTYNDFGDWLRTDDHVIWIIGLVLGYMYYLLTTQEV